MKSGFPSEDKRLTIISPQIFSEFPEIRAGMSTKFGSDAKSAFHFNLSYRVGDDPFRVKRNRDSFLSRMEILESELALPLQCHSQTVLRADKPDEYDSCDALISHQKNVALAVVIADCVPILLYDPVHQVLGAVHAGWRGTAGSILFRTIERMKEEFKTDPVHLKVFIGPSAGKCCYEVGEEVAVMFGNKNVFYRENKYFLDLKKENKAQLEIQGVRGRNIEMSSSCTICEEQVFHSYRRDGRNSGRMMAVICLR